MHISLSSPHISIPRAFNLSDAGLNQELRGRAVTTDQKPLFAKLRKDATAPLYGVESGL